MGTRVPGKVSTSVRGVTSGYSRATPITEGVTSTILEPLSMSVLLHGGCQDEPRITALSVRIRFSIARATLDSS